MEGHSKKKIRIQLWEPYDLYVEEICKYYRVLVKSKETRTCYINMVEDLNVINYRCWYKTSDVRCKENCSPGKTEKYGGGMPLCDATPSTRFMVTYLIKK